MTLSCATADSLSDSSFFDRTISQLRTTCKYYTGYPKDPGPSRVIHFTSEREFIRLLNEGYPFVVAFTIRGNYTKHLDKVLEEAAAEFCPHVKFMRVECPKYPGFCITRLRKDYPFIEAIWISLWKLHNLRDKYVEKIYLDLCESGLYNKPDSQKLFQTALKYITNRYKQLTREGWLIQMLLTTTCQFCLLITTSVLMDLENILSAMEYKHQALSKDICERNAVNSRKWKKKICTRFLRLSKL